MMSDEIEVEVNLMASGKIKHNPDRDMKNVQGEAQPSTSVIIWEILFDDEDYGKVYGNNFLG